MSTSLFDASRRPIIVDGVLTQAMSSLVGGAFLAAFALALGASNLQIGLLAAIPALGQLGQLAAVLLIRRVGRRKPVAVGAAVASRATWFAIAAVPLVAGSEIAFALVAALLLVASVFGSIGGVAWLSWMRDLIPMEAMGRFFARRMQLANGAAVLLSLGGGFFVDHWLRGGRPPALGYSVLFAVGAILGLGAVVALSRAGEPRTTSPRKAGGDGDPGILARLGVPFRNENFRRLIAFSAAWTFTLTFAAPFYVVYMIERIGLAISTVILLSVVSQVVGILLLPFWGRAVDRFSNSSVLGAAGTILLAAILGWTFTTFPDVHALTFPLLLAIHVALGAAMAGITLATGNISLKLSPSGEAEAYLTSLGLVNALVAAAAPLLAGALASIVGEADLTLNLVFSEAARTLTLPAVSLQGLDFLFVVAFLLGLYSMHRLAFVQEEGTVDEAIVLEELREQIMEDMRAVASFATLRQIVSFPGSLVRGRSERGAGEGKESRA